MELRLDKNKVIKRSISLLNISKINHVIKNPLADKNKSTLRN